VQSQGGGERTCTGEKPRFSQDGVERRGECRQAEGVEGGEEGERTAKGENEKVDHMGGNRAGEFWLKKGKSRPHFPIG